jgi:hypothetical protein
MNFIVQGGLVGLDHESEDKTVFIYVVLAGGEGYVAFFSEFVGGLRRLGISKWLPETDSTVGG